MRSALRLAAFDAWEVLCARGGLDTDGARRGLGDGAGGFRGRADASEYSSAQLGRDVAAAIVGACGQQRSTTVAVDAFGTLPLWFQQEPWTQALLAALPPGSQVGLDADSFFNSTEAEQAARQDALSLVVGGLVLVELQPANERVDASLSGACFPSAGVTRPIEMVIVSGEKRAEPSQVQSALPEAVAPEPLRLRQPPYPLVAVPEGTHQIGCTPAQRRCADDEPQRTVALRAFEIGVYEITEALYCTVAKKERWSVKWLDCSSQHPVNVTWWEATQFANALSRAHGLPACYGLTESMQRSHWIEPTTCTGYRLPTDAEWEVAARGGVDTLYAGSDTVDDVGWYWRTGARSRQPVGTRAPNGYGLYDMSGNVWEWTWDWYTSQPPSSSTNPIGPQQGQTRGARGGGWSDWNADQLRTARRAGLPAETRSDDLGFRLARTL